MRDIRPEEKDLTFEKILNALLDGKNNLDLKTHIYKPRQLAGLKIVENVLKGDKCVMSSKIINGFTEKYLRYMVSFKRMSRQETIRAISEPREAIKDKKNKFTKDLS